MTTAALRRLEFAPPQLSGRPTAVALALVVHAALALALSNSVQWRHKQEPQVAEVFEAELWRAMPQVAPPPTPEVPIAVAAPAPAPPPAPAVVEPPPDIAVEKAADKKAKLDAAVKLLAAKQAEKAAAVKAAKDLAEKEAAKEAASEAAEKIASQTRQQEQLKRMMDLANRGANTSSSQAAISAGPSAAYGARVIARVRPNITFTQELAGNPTAEVEVRCGPDGTILSRRLLKSSGQKSWDEAVLKAIDKTEILPREADGRMPPVMVLAFSPRG